MKIGYNYAQTGERIYKLHFLTLKNLSLLSLHLKSKIADDSISPPSNFNKK